MTRNKMAVDLRVFTVKRGVQFPLALLKDALPTTEEALFFAKLYKLTETQLGNLLFELFHCDVIEALTGQSHEHSTDLQDYVVELGYEYMIERGDINFSAQAPKGVILPEVWDSLQIEIADSIQKVADKLSDVIAHMPGKEGQMLFKSMMTMNAKRPVIGDYKAYVHHKPAAPNLVILDVSGSMSENTIKTIVDDVVALSWKANATLAVVSNTTTYWEPGSFDSAAVLRASEFGGTYYETLSALLDEDWGVVVTIADYDSSRSAKSAIAKCKGSIDTVLDISLVNQPTFLAECVGQLARKTQPLLIADGDLTR